MRVSFVDESSYSSLENEHLTRVHGLDGVECAFHNGALSEDALIERAENADVIVIGSATTTCSASVLRRLTSLRAIVVVGLNSRAVDVAYCARHSIEVIEFRNYTAISSAEIAFAGTLMLAHRVHSAWRHVVYNQTSQNNFFSGWELNGRTLGVVGAGVLGREMMRIGRGFEMEILCHTKHPSVSRARELGLKEFSDLKKVLAESDVVMLAVSAARDTESMIDQRQLRKMSSDALLVNVAAPEVVDLRALAQALHDRDIAGAVLDTVQLPGNTPEDRILMREMINSPNVLVLPHLGLETGEARQRLGDQVVVVLEAMAHGESFPGGATSVRGTG